MLHSFTDKHSAFKSGEDDKAVKGDTIEREKQHGKEKNMILKHHNRWCGVTEYSVQVCSKYKHKTLMTIL